MTDRTVLPAAFRRRLVPVGRIGRDSVVSFLDGHGTRLAAQLGFFSLIAFPALLLIAVWALGAIFDSPRVRTELVDEIMNALPLEAVQGRQEIVSLLDGLTQGAGGIGLFSIAALLYSGSGAVGALRQAVESSLGPDGPSRSFPRSKLFDIGVTIVTMPILLVVIGLSLSRELSDVVHREALLDFLATVSGGGLTSLVVVILLFSWLYWILNPGGRSWSSALLGGLSTGLLLAGLLELLTLWFNNTGGSRIYGALAGFIGLLLLLHLACIVVVLGAHVAAEIYRQYSGNDGSQPPATPTAPEGSGPLAVAERDPYGGPWGENSEPGGMPGDKPARG